MAEPGLDTGSDPCYSVSHEKLLRNDSTEHIGDKSWTNRPNPMQMAKGTHYSQAPQLASLARAPVGQQIQGLIVLKKKKSN